MSGDGLSKIICREKEHERLKQIRVSQLRNS